MPKWVTYVLAAVFVILLAVALAAPIGPMPGVRIGGEVSPPPADWSDINLPHQVQLKATGGLLPRVVNIWVVEEGNALYVFGATGSGWVDATLQAPQVALRIADQVYALTAQALDNVDPAVYQKYVDRYAEDYPEIVAQMPTLDEIASAGVAFRLDR